MFNSSQDEAIREAIAYECDRQHVGEDRRAFLRSAYERAVRARQAGERYFTLDFALDLAGELEPSNGGRVRITPVTFADGGSSASPSSLPDFLPKLFDAVPSFADSEDAVREWVREFLWAHPFTDGNGRVAFVLYNWLRDSLMEPVQLPYFFGEKPE